VTASARTVRRVGYKIAMLDDTTIDNARELRACGLSPKEIARSLGVRPAIVADLVRTFAAERDAAAPNGGLVDCQTNAGWSAGLTITGHPEWADPGAREGTGGLVSVLVTRRRRHRRAATVCVYLLDVYCLGVKNAIGPDNMDDRALQRFTGHAFSGYDAPPIPAPIELARDPVLGSAEYAHALGFAPHPDFEQARAHLGAWAGPSAITFGCDGKPNYIQGPYDDPRHVLRTLRRAVGRDGFHYTVNGGFDELHATGRRHRDRDRQPQPEQSPVLKLWMTSPTRSSEVKPCAGRSTARSGLVATARPTPILLGRSKELPASSLEISGQGRARP
jgi:hypothetical protein